MSQDLAKAPPEGIERRVDLKWRMENDLPHLYANHFSYTDTGNEIILVFGSYLPTGFPNQKQEDIEEFLDNSTVNPLVKIVLSRAGINAFYQMLKKQLEESGEESNE